MTLRAALVFFVSASACVAASIELRVDFSKTNGIIRPLHGINKGPLTFGGTVDLSEKHRELAPPFNRLHDCHWPVPDVVDVHVVFPNSTADPSKPENYDFAMTDEYIASVRATGAQIIYRLGESIEHTTTKRFVHPRRDVENWANICVGIVRHYNEGWAHGTNANIHYWEIWNEPENRPAMWTGNDEDFLKLYAAASRALKQHDAKLKIGGPAFGYTGQFVNGQFHASAFVSIFLARCRSDALPLDFFSWHCYTADPGELVQRAKAVRALLDSFGFTKTESHLNEWNYLPNSSWTPLTRKAPADERQRAYDEISGAAGAAFVAAALIELQDAPVDVCNLYHADVGAFGMFSEQGVPRPNYFSVRAFRELLRTPERASISGAISNKLAAIAGKSGNSSQILIANHSLDADEITLHLDGTEKREAIVRIVDAQHQFEPVSTNTITSSIALRLPKSGVALITLNPAKR